MKSNSIAKDLNPLQESAKKNNFQKFILVDKKGNTSTRIILFIPDIELREQIICDHFLSRHVQLFLEQAVGVKIISRDKPWDFEIALSNNDELIIEITSIADNKADTIHDIWPNLQVYTSGGVAFEPYRKSFEKLLSRPITYIDTYLASEGYLATQKRPNTTAMSLIVDNGIFFEFVPFINENIDKEGRIKQGAEVLTLKEVEENTEYVLLISTVAGAWRYMIGDTVMITDKERAEIVITGRTKHFLNVVGEQLSVHQMNTAVQHLEQKFDLEIKEFTVAAIRQGETYINKWYLGTNKKAAASTLAACLDNQLALLNKNYKVARHQALRGVKVEVVPISHFYRWSEVFKKLGGQTKIPRVMQEDDFNEFERYIATLKAD